HRNVGAFFYVVWRESRERHLQLQCDLGSMIFNSTGFTQTLYDGRPYYPVPLHVHHSTDLDRSGDSQATDDDRRNDDRGIVADKRRDRFKVHWLASCVCSVP